jgi:hypothetical protein
MSHAYNPAFMRAETGGWQIPGQPGLHLETLSQNTNKKTQPSNWKQEKKKKDWLCCSNEDIVVLEDRNEQWTNVMDQNKNPDKAILV